MSTVSLYQKYRPKNFDEVIGQDTIIQTIKNQIANNTIANAYLFYGTRGLGKTSTARIIANELGITDEDLYEIDAASNRGIDDIRSIREGVKGRPFSSPYKMYLIDEVHMLSKDAFNALLKTLEEPPEFVIFILATTELHKVPDTIQSRTQVFTFSQPETKDLTKLIKRVAKAEGQPDLSDDIIAAIVEQARGSYRDALGRLQLYFANPESITLHSSNVASAVVDAVGVGSFDPVWLDEIASHSDPRVIYVELLNLSSEALANKLKGDSTILVTSKHLRIILEARNFFTHNDPVAERAALVMVISQLFSEE